MAQALPQSRKRPKKLLGWSWLDSISVLSSLQLLVVNHLSFIRCKSPFSDSCRIAVDKSGVRGESRGNAWLKVKINLSHVKHPSWKSASLKLCYKVSEVSIPVQIHTLDMPKQSLLERSHVVAYPWIAENVSAESYIKTLDRQLPTKK